MAIANADGSIVLTTKVDDSGIKKWIESIKSGTNQATEATKKYERQAKQSGEKVKLSFDNVGKSIQKVASYLGIAFGIKAFVQFSNASANMATQTEASVQRLVDIYGSASDSVGDFIDANARALGMSKAAAASFSSVYGNLFSVWADQATNAELTSRYLQMTAVVASKTGKTVEDVQERVRSGLLGNTEAIEDLGIFVNVKTIEMTDAFQRMANGKSWEQLDAYTQQQIRSMAILEQATAKYGDEVADTSATIRNQFNAAYEDFQDSWGNIVNTVLLPVLQVLTEIFNIATAGLNALLGRSGKILEDVSDEIEEPKELETFNEETKEVLKNTEGIKDNANSTLKSQEEINKSLKNTEKQTKKVLAGFDDIQILSAQTADNTSGGLDSGLQGLGGDLSGDAPDGSAYVEEIDETLTAIMGIVALSLAAVGLILLFTGNIGWGIGFIISGAAMLTVTMASASKFKEKGIIQMLTTIMGVAGGALLALGIILLWIGGVVGAPIAIGMIIAGGALIVSAVAAQAAFAPNDIAAWLSLIMGIAGGALLALGVILCMVGSIPMGVGMIIAGAGSLVTAFALNSNAVVDWIRNVWSAVVGFFNRYIAPVFTAKFWLDLAKNCGNGLIGGFEAAINGIIGMFEKMINWIVDGINSIGFDIPDWLGGGHFGFNIPRASFGRVSIPRLAQGAVIPPNREFLAVLGDQKQGTNIEAPLSTIQDAVSAVVSTQNEETQYILREILEAILGIQIGDEVIGRASQRYNNSMIKMYGG